MFAIVDRLRSKPFLVVAISCCLGLASAEAAVVINYGDLTGTNVEYQDVTESNAGASALFGAPVGPPPGDSLDFDPKTFSAQSSGAATSLTDGQLNFQLEGLGTAINTLSINEQGDYNLTGAGTDNTKVTFSIALASVKVFAIDGVDLLSPVNLDVGSAVITGMRNVVDNGQGSGNWALSLNYDVDGALTAAGEDFQFGASRLKIAIDDTLTASSELITTEFDQGSTTTFATTAFIQKKDFVIGVDVTTIPEPSSLAMLFVVGCAAGATRRRRR